MARLRLPLPSARKNPMTHAAASDAIVSSRARSAPFQYGLEMSASQKMWVSKVASTRVDRLLHVSRRDLLLRCEPLERAVLLQRLDRRLASGAELLVGLSVVDAKGVRLGKQIRDRELARVLLLVRTRCRILGQHCIGSPEEDLGDRILVPRVALEVHLRLARRLELVVQGLEVILVFRACLDGDVLSREIVRALDRLGIPG